MNTISLPLLPAAPFAPSASPSRRAFLRYLSIGAAAAVLEGCGGGAGGADGAASPVTAPAAPAAPAAPVVVAPVTPAPVVTAPVVSPAPVAQALSIPNIAFIQGTPSSFSLAEYITAANLAAVTLTLNAATLPSGVTFNAANRSFDYDGRGAAGAAEGLMLTAIGA